MEHIRHLNALAWKAPHTRVMIGLFTAMHTRILDNPFFVGALETLKEGNTDINTIIGYLEHGMGHGYWMPEQIEMLRQVLRDVYHQ
jgi:hypothetical protein